MVDSITNYDFTPQVEQGSASACEDLAASCWSPDDRRDSKPASDTGDGAAPKVDTLKQKLEAERRHTEASGTKKPEWKKGEPDTIHTEAEAPTNDEITKALERAKTTIKNPLALDLYDDLVQGKMGHFGWTMHGLSSDKEGMAKLREAVDELNKHLRYPVEIVTGEGNPPELGLKFKPYHYERPRDPENPRDLLGHSEKLSLTIWSHGKYEAKSSFVFGNQGGNLPAGLAESEYRLKRMLVSSLK